MTKKRRPLSDQELSDMYDARFDAVHPHYVRLKQMHCYQPIEVAIGGESLTLCAMILERALQLQIDLDLKSSREVKDRIYQAEAKKDTEGE